MTQLEGLLEWCEIRQREESSLEVVSEKTEDKVFHFGKSEAFKDVIENIKNL